MSLLSAMPTPDVDADKHQEKKTYNATAHMPFVLSVLPTSAKHRGRQANQARQPQALATAVSQARCRVSRLREIFFSVW